MVGDLKKILVIDDEPIIRDTLQVLLEEFDYSVITASNGKEGVQLYKSEKPDMVISDINMPEMNGFQVCEFLNKDNSDFPIIVLSGLGTLDQAMQAIQFGAWDFLTKPIKDFGILEHSINKAFEKADLLVENKKYREYLEATVEKKTSELIVEKDIRKISEAKFNNLFENMNDSVYLVFDGVIVDCNRKAKEGLKLDQVNLIGNSIWEFFPEFQPDGTPSKYYEIFIDKALDGVPQRLELITLNGKKEEIYSEISFNSLVQNSKNYLLIISRDITARKAAEKELKKLSMAVEQSPAMVMITDVKSRIEYINSAFSDVTGYMLGEIIGKTPRILKSGKMSDDFYKEMWETISSGKPWHGELNNKKKNGEFFWEYSYINPIKDDLGKITHFVAVKEDITVRKHYEEKLLKQSNFDDLTGLPNRILAMDRLSQGVDHSHRNGLKMFLMLVDIDHFKKINDSLGHMVGDELIKKAGERLINCVRKYDTVARLGGDEFLVIISDAVSTKSNIAEKILKSFAKPFFVSGRELYVTVSIGVTVCPEDSSDPYILLRNADSAMFKAKEEGRDKFWFFSSEMNEVAMKRLEIETELRHALDKNEIYLNFQPKISIKTGTIMGAETLMRWKNDRLGFVPPDVFIPIAEDTGLIIELSDYMMKEACKQGIIWQSAVGYTINLAVNVSSKQFKNPDFLEDINNILLNSGFAPSNFEIEITESLIVENVKKTVSILDELNQKGVKISIDDFGTGFSSLSYLKKFPVDKLKVDRAFINNMTNDDEDATLVKAIIAMGHSLGLEVIAEGVETEEQLNFLKTLNCDIVQGYFYSRPLEGDDFIDFLKNWKVK